MGPHKQSAILIDKLSLLNSVLALIMSRYIDVYYLNLSKSLKKKWIVDMLGGFGVCLLKMEQNPEPVLRNYISKIGDYSEAVYKEIFDPDFPFSSLSKLFQNIQFLDKKLKILILHFLDGLAFDLPRFMLWAEHFKKQYKNIYLYSCNPVYVIFGKKYKNEYKIVWPVFFCYLRIVSKTILNIAAKVLNRIRKKITRFPNRKKKESRWDFNHKKQSPPSAFDILFIPHQGVAYGNLFLKDHFYDENPQNPFYKGNILHIELQDTESLAVQQFNKIVSYYETNNIPFCFYKRPELKGMFKDFIRFVKVFFINYLGSIGGIKRYYLGAIGILCINYLKYRRFQGFFSRFQNAKIALIGYDHVCPLELTLALESLGVTTLATQERFIAPFYSMFRLIMDYYFVCSEYVKQVIEKNENFAINHMASIGFIRGDIIHEEKANSGHVRSKLRHDQLLVVAYDWPSAETEIDNYFMPDADWNTNKQFYTDLIRLAQRYGDIQFILRSKDDVWCSLQTFSETVALINVLPNIEIHRNYGEFNLSYRLLSAADIIIAKYTSLVDEAIVADIPVIIHDYYPNGSKRIYDVWNYENYPVYAFSYEDLERKFNQILIEKKQGNNGILSKMRRSFYSDRHDGTVRDMLQMQLMSIYQNKTDMTNNQFDNVPVGGNQ